MPSVLSGLQRDVASALPGCDYHDPANFDWSGGDLPAEVVLRGPGEHTHGSQPQPPHADRSRPAGDGALGPGDT